MNANILITCAISMFSVGLACCQLSSTNSISFQGALTTSTGQPLTNGSYTLSFKFYNVLTDGTAIATNSMSNVSINDGIASTVIPVNSTLFNGKTLYLGISVNGCSELAPRIMLTAVPYSLATRGVSVDASGHLGLGRDSFTNENVAVNGIVSAGPTVGNFAFRGAYSDGAHYDYNGRQTAFYRLVGGPSSATGFGVVVSTNDGGSLSSPVVWMMNQPNNSFDVRSQLVQGGLPGNVLFSVNASGETQCGTSTQPGQLSVFGASGSMVFQARSTGTTMVRVLEITGGSDLAERFNVTGESQNEEFCARAGMIVSVDPTGSRKFKLSDEAYDRKRVGIISGGNGVKAGLVLQDEGNPAVSGDQPIALTGQVWCYADASFGTIRPGDLLTTSTTRGHAMKVIHFDKARFAVLGQALTELKEGRGWVQVLVGKQ
jgi:hypothetical protein